MPSCTCGGQGQPTAGGSLVHSNSVCHICLRAPFTPGPSHQPQYFIFKIKWIDLFCRLEFSSPYWHNLTSGFKRNIWITTYFGFGSRVLFFFMVILFSSCCNSKQITTAMVSLIEIQTLRCVCFLFTFKRTFFFHSLSTWNCLLFIAQFCVTQKSRDKWRANLWNSSYAALRQ